MKDRETARYAILAGWLIALLGVVCYLIATKRAGAGAEIVAALTGQGAVGWASIALLTAGIAIWLFGNLALGRRDGDRGKEPEAP